MTSRHAFVAILLALVGSPSVSRAAPQASWDLVRDFGLIGR